MRPDDPRHGTLAGYVRHSREGEAACDPCKAAKNAYESIARTKPANRERRRITSRAHSRALSALKQRHPYEFQRLYHMALADEKDAS